MDHIQYEELEFVGIRCIRLDKLAVLIDIGYLLIDHMNRHGIVHDFGQLGHLEQIVQDDAVIIGESAIRFTAGNHLVGHFVVFHDGGCPVLKTEHTDTLLRIRLGDDLGAALAAGQKRRADKARICDALEHVIHRKDVQPLDALTLQETLQSGFCHGSEPAAVAVRRGCDASLFLK